MPDRDRDQQQRKAEIDPEDEREALVLHSILAKLRTDISTIEVSDARHRLRTTECFVGADAVDLLLRENYATRREDAVRVLRVLAAKYGLFEYVPFDHRVEDDYRFFRFSKRGMDDLQRRSSASSAGSSRGSSSSSLKVLADLSNAVEVRDRTHRSLSFRRCFDSHEAVDYLVSNGRATSRDEAVRIVLDLASPAEGDGDGGHAPLQRVEGRHVFEDGEHFYRFTEGGRGEVMVAAALQRQSSRRDVRGRGFDGRRGSGEDRRDAAAPPAEAWPNSEPGAGAADTTTASLDGGEGYDGDVDASSSSPAVVGGGGGGVGIEGSKNPGDDWSASFTDLSVAEV